MEFIIENDHIKGDLAFNEIAISSSEKNGYRPYELFVSSLAGCSGSLLRTILQKRRHSYQKLEMKVSSVRNPNHANQIEGLSLTAYIHSKEPFTPQQAEKMALLVVKNCSMIQSVIQSIDIKFMVKMISLIGDHS
ncbi:OsmC family protein [Bacillus sp. PK3_68]|uniref:OsmC family protein n=1 Tax=Bacillus sp. PK3_68 TaxID=2027408 RepID=UPI000E71FEB0|nr:OsmC family protein [Bacillus sp. PK3_68]RJS62402.1 hypothetical protein CJ483_22100 [Bacillus sp. PK3_68]